VRRLYSTFAQGPPGIGLLLIRLLVGIVDAVYGVSQFRAGLGLGAVLVDALHVGLGLLLVLGLWTPVAGTLLALVAFADAYACPDIRWLCIGIGTMAVAIALIGPGGWSVDARLFGWKRLEIPERKRPRAPR
jgi:uncharacterized membrane protein YphA (DoxX/SURF4 family)